MKNKKIVVSKDFETETLKILEFFFSPIFRENSKFLMKSFVKKIIYLELLYKIITPTNLDNFSSDKQLSLYIEKIFKKTFLKNSKLKLIFQNEHINKDTNISFQFNGDNHSYSPLLNAYIRKTKTFMSSYYKYEHLFKNLSKKEKEEENYLNILEANNFINRVYNNKEKTVTYYNVFNQPLETLEFYEDILNSAIEDNETKKYANSFLRSYKHLLNKKSMAYFQILKTKKIPREYISNQLSKVASFENSEQLNLILNNILNNYKITKDRVEEIIKENDLKAENILNDKEISVYKINQFKDINILGSSQWCISYSKDYYQEYIDKTALPNHNLNLHPDDVKCVLEGSHYIAYNFNIEENNPLFQIAFTIAPNGILHAAHDKDDKNILNEIHEVLPFQKILKTILYKKNKEEELNKSKLYIDFNGRKYIPTREIFSNFINPVSVYNKIHKNGNILLQNEKIGFNDKEIRGIKNCLSVSEQHFEENKIISVDKYTKDVFLLYSNLINDINKHYSNQLNNEQTSNGYNKHIHIINIFKHSYLFKALFTKYKNNEDLNKVYLKNRVSIINIINNTLDNNLENYNENYNKEADTLISPFIFIMDNIMEDKSIKFNAKLNLSLQYAKLKGSMKKVFQNFNYKPEILVKHMKNIHPLYFLNSPSVFKLKELEPIWKNINALIQNEKFKNDIYEPEKFKTTSILSIRNEPKILEYIEPETIQELLKENLKKEKINSQTYFGKISFKMPENCYNLGEQLQFLYQNKIINKDIIDNFIDYDKINKYDLSNVSAKNTEDFKKYILNE